MFLLSATVAGDVEGLGLFEKRKSSVRRSARAYVGGGSGGRLTDTNSKGTTSGRAISSRLGKYALLDFMSSKWQYLHLTLNYGS